MVVKLPEEFIEEDEWIDNLHKPKLKIEVKGGEGSGNHGHVSVPGESGGSAAKGGTGSAGVYSSPAKNKTVSDYAKSDLQSCS